MTAMLISFSSCRLKQQCFAWSAQEELRLVYAELHAVAHTQKETIAKVEARWEKAVGRTQLLLKGQPLQAMTKQVIKELQHQPLQVTSNLCGACLLTLTCHCHAYVGDQNAMHLRCFFDIDTSLCARYSYRCVCSCWLRRGHITAPMPAVK